jgi:hypothetical protein
VQDIHFGMQLEHPNVFQLVVSKFQLIPCRGASS